MSRLNVQNQTGMVLLIILALLALALLTVPSPPPGGAFGQPAPATSLSAPSVYSPGH